jgi:spermidine synthase
LVIRTITHSRDRSAAIVAWPFAITMFLGAFLLFAIEPFVARLVLPLFGGAPAVWNSCLLFFQVALLGGYYYATRFLRWANRRSKAALHLAVLASPLFVLPIHLMPVAVTAGGRGVLAVVWLLTVAIGLPFVVLATTASTLQYWFGNMDDDATRDPYFLYAASNAGSVSALLGYPVLIEPRLRLVEQARLWSYGYDIFLSCMVLCFVIAWRSSSRRMPAHFPAPTAERTSVPEVFRWATLSFVPASLMIGVTTYLSTDVASVPLLWVVPLAVYLVTFILAFSRWRPVATDLARDALPLFAILVTLSLTAKTSLGLGATIALHLITLFAGAQVCHGALAAARPDVNKLPTYYLWIAVGGALAGIFNALIAPLLFRSIAEYPLTLIAACLASSMNRNRNAVRQFDRASFRWLIPVGVGGLTATLLTIVPRVNDGAPVVMAALGVPAIITFSQIQQRFLFGLCIAAMFFGGTLAGYGYGRTAYAARTFFGVYHVSTTEDGRYRVLYHGTTVHGTQAVDVNRRHEPLTYYHHTGPFGQAFAALPIASRTRDIGVIGLGAGSLAAYARPDQHWTFYEIDPEVERIGRDPKYFTFLEDCGAACRVVIGDGRLSLTYGAPGQFGLLVLDAFSSDAIPIHLLTNEAFGIYLSRLAPGGVIAVHISNRYLELFPILERLSEAHGLVAVEQRQRITEEEHREGKESSEWVLLARKKNDLGPIATDSRWNTPHIPRQTPIWTDDFSNILSAMRRSAPD